jgi:hypothetical protein
MDRSRVRSINLSEMNATFLDLYEKGERQSER